MGDKYTKLHKKKNPKLTKEEIKQRRIKRKQDKEANKHGKAKESKGPSNES